MGGIGRGKRLHGHPHFELDFSPALQNAMGG